MSADEEKIRAAVDIIHEEMNKAGGNGFVSVLQGPDGTSTLVYVSVGEHNTIVHMAKEIFGEVKNPVLKQVGTYSKKE